MCGILSICALPASYFTNSSKLSTGKWVKIQVDSTGVYAISHSQLRQWGFDHPDRVAVYGIGAAAHTEHNFLTTVPDDLPLTPALNRNNRLIFFAEGDVRAIATSDRSAVFTRNYYDTHSYYFLTESEEPLEAMPETAYDGNPAEKSIVDRSLAVSFCEPEEYRPGFGGAHFFSRPIAPGTVREFTLNIEDFTNRRNGGSRVGYLGFTYVVNQEFAGQFSPAVTINDDWNVTAADFGRTAQHASTSLYASRSGSLNFSSESAPDKIKFTYGVPADFEGDFWCIDRIYAIYTRLNRLTNSPWRMLNLASVSVGTPLLISSVDENLEIWNLTNLQAPSCLKPQISEDGNALVTLDKTASNAAQILIFDSSATFPTPEYCGEIPNQNLHGQTEVPQMLIVTTHSLLESARELAQIHASTRNFDVSVVCQDDIFNEFSSGARTPQAIHRYIKMLHDRDHSGRFGYVLLYGASMSDNRFLTRAEADVLVCMQAENATDASSNSTNYSPDVYFGMVDDSFTFDKLALQPSQLSVGRLPVQNSTQASGVNRKIQRFLTNPTAPANTMRSLFISDVDASATSDEHTVHNDTARAVLRRAYPDMVFTNLDLIEYSGQQESKGHIKQLAATRYSEELKNGCNLIWYSGHASEHIFSIPEIWNFEREFSNSSQVYPWAVFSTCRIFNFDAYENCLLSMMVLNPDGGIIGGTGSGREVYLVYNEWLNLAMARQLAAATPGMTMADVFRLARYSIIPTDNPTIANNRAKNALCYNYCGDPSIPLHIPSANVEFQAPADGLTEIVTGTVTTIDANISGNGNFSGNGQLRVFAPRVYRNRKPDTAHSQRSSKTWLGFLEHTFVDETEVIAEYPVQVDNGRISASVVLPEIELDSARVYIYVRDSSTGALATGHTVVNLKPGSDTGATYAAPSFDRMYIDTPEGTSGSVLANPRIFCAEISPGEAGIKSGISGFGRCKLTLDGNYNLSRELSTQFNSAGQLEVHCKLPKLLDGPHSIEITITDYVANTTTGRYDFTVDSTPLSGRIALQNQASAVRQNVDIDIEDLSDGVYVNSLIIVDATGNTVRSVASPALPYNWNLTDADGNAVDDGEYRVHAKLSRGTSYGSTDEVRFTVIR